MAYEYKKIESGGGEITLEEKSVTYATNGTRSVTPSAGYDGLSKVNITVNVPQPTSETKTLTITGNGSSVITPSSGVDYLSSVNLTIDVPVTNPLAVAWNNYKNLSNRRTDWGGAFTVNSTSPGDSAFGYMFYQMQNYDGLNWTGSESVTNFNSMFNRNYNLKRAPQFDTTSALNLSSMFDSCGNLESAPSINALAPTNVSRMFAGCKKITSAPLFNTSAVTSMNNVSSMFYDCRALTEIPAYDFSGIPETTSGTGNPFPNDAALTAIHATGIKFRMYIQNTSLGHDEIVELFNNLGTVTSNTITIGATKLALLSEAEKDIARNKGWTLAE